MACLSSRQGWCSFSVKTNGKAVAKQMIQLLPSKWYSCCQANGTAVAKQMMRLLASGLLKWHNMDDHWWYRVRVTYVKTFVRSSDLIPLLSDLGLYIQISEDYAGMTEASIVPNWRIWRLWWGANLQVPDGLALKRVHAKQILCCRVRKMKDLDQISQKVILRFRSSTASDLNLAASPSEVSFGLCL